MNLSANETIFNGPQSNVTSRDATPEVGGPTDDRGEALADYSLAEVIHFLSIYEEEIACVHPIIETKSLIENVPKILDVIRSQELGTSRSDGIGWKDVHILKIAIATSLIHERHGKNETSDRLIESVERDVGVISLASEVELKDIQIMGMLVWSLLFAYNEANIFLRVFTSAIQLKSFLRGVRLDAQHDKHSRWVSIEDRV